MHHAIKGTPARRRRRRRRRRWRRRRSRGPSYTSLNAASCRASNVRRGRPAFSVPGRTIFPPSRLPSYIERASKCVRVLPSRRVETAHARTQARTAASGGFIHKVTRFARKRLRARVNDRNRRLRQLLLSCVPTYLPGPARRR